MSATATTDADERTELSDASDVKAGSERSLSHKAPVHEFRRSEAPAGSLRQ